MYILEKVESVAKNCVRSAPIVFDKARGAELYDEHGRRYIDFSSGRGASAYGHGDPKVCSALIDYICNDGILQTRDRTSVAKRTFVEKFVTAVLQPRSLDYKILFTDPSAGTTTEVALRLASRHKKRSGIVSFTNGFHGLTEGARTLNYMISGQFEMLGPRGKGMYMPYCGYFNDSFDTLEYLQRYLMDAYRHSELPAAIIVEPVQIEGGVQIATASTSF
jgi:diaminobutyrate-2-oxoglutarate transaminase